MSLRLKAYEDELPALSVRRAALRKSLRYVTGAWMMGVVWGSSIGGSHVKSFARMLGFNDLAFGIMSAMPFLATFGQIPASLIVERTGLRKQLFLYPMIISRLLWLVIAAIPLLPIPSTTAVATMLVLLGVSWLLAAVGGPPWNSWMGDLIPRRIRGRFMANRNRLCSAVQIVVIIALGIILDYVTVPGAPETAHDQPMLLWACVIAFIVAGIMGTADILTFFRIREVIPTTPDKPREPAINIRVKRSARSGVVFTLSYYVLYVLAVIREVLLDPLKDRAFRGYVLFAAAMAFSASVSGWYYWLYAMDNLGFNKLATNVVFLVTVPLAGVCTSTAWGKLIDRWGRRPVLIISTIGTIVSVAPWVLITRTTSHPVFIDSALAWASSLVGHILGHDVTLVGPDAPIGAYLLGTLGCTVGGCAWNGMGLAQTGVILGFADGRGRSKYMASSAVLISIGGTLGGFAGGILSESLLFLQRHPIGPFEWNNCHMTFFVSVLARVAALAMLINMPDPGAGRVRDLVRSVGSNVYNAVYPRLFYRLRTIGWGRHNPGSRDDGGA